MWHTFLVQCLGVLLILLWGYIMQDEKCWESPTIALSPSSSCLHLIDKRPPQMLLFSFIFHAQKNMRPIWLQPPPRAASGYTRDSLAKLNTAEQNNTQKPLLWGLLHSLSLRPFCLPAAGASCDPGPLSCTHGGNEGCWAARGFAGEGLGVYGVCVRDRRAVLSQTVKWGFLSVLSDDTCAAAVDVLTFLLACRCGCL